MGSGGRNFFGTRGDFYGELLVWSGVFRAFFELLVSGNDLIGVLLLLFGKVGVFTNAAQEMGFFSGKVEFAVSKHSAYFDIELSFHASRSRQNPKWVMCKFLAL